MQRPADIPARAAFCISGANQYMTTKNTGGPSRSLSLRIPTKLHDALVRAAEDNGLNLSAYLKMLAAKQIKTEQKQAALS
jgi:hypothetical protein